MFHCKVMNVNEENYESEKILYWLYFKMRQYLIKWRENMTKLYSYKSSGTS